MSRPFIITSGAYVDSELVAEFGLLPPAFLPLGNRRLFARQYQALKPFASRIILTVPDHFVLDPIDEAHLATLDIEIVGIPEGLTLGQSVVYAINATACGHGAVSILHGDSLHTELSYDAVDAVSVTKSLPPPGYSWAWARRTEAGVRIFDPDHVPDPTDMALTGFFSVSDGARLVQAITRNGSDFIAGLAEYASIVPLQTLASGHWFDFGHCSTYHRSRREMTTEREFNRLSTAGRSITKSGRNPDKLLAEALWYENLPPALRIYTPSYLGRSEQDAGVSYSLEYLHLPSLADLAVFGRLPLTAWRRIFDSCDEALSALALRQGSAESLVSARSLLCDKTLRRLEQLAASRSLSLTTPCRLGTRSLPPLAKIAETVAGLVTEPERATLIHGDFCFSNILYDMRADIVRMIDPRGMDANGTISNFGDIRYDIAKLYHSAVGLYDHIMAGNYSFDRRGDLDFELELPDTYEVQLIRDEFLTHEFAGLTITAAKALPIAILLFLSMPPLHSDDPQRQLALLANGLRLFDLLDRTGS